jgi:hypothetical protein
MPRELRPRLDAGGLARLERQLAIDMARIAPGTILSTEGGTARAPERVEMEAAANELLAVYRDGVRIAPQVETTPLLAMLQASEVDVPPKLAAQAALGYAFYLVEITFRIMLPEDVRPLSARFALRLNDDVAEAERRVRPLSLFPRYEDAELFRAEVEGSFGIDASATISIPTLAGAALPFADVSAETAVKAGIVVGPFRYRFMRAKIEVAGEGDQQLEWRYQMESALLGANDFKSVLVLKIADEATSVVVAASLGVVPYKRRWLVFKKRLAEMTDSTPPGAPMKIELAR